MPDKEYYTSERFIWDALIRQAEKGVSGLQDTWKRLKRIDPFVITWPADTVKSSEGVDVTGPVLRELDPDSSTWKDATVEAIKLTNAYALLRAQQGADFVQVILESQHGARCWTLPITRSGDVYVLGKPKISVDEEHIGLLWRPGPQAS
jgi:hypothetical protein